MGEKLIIEISKSQITVFAVSVAERCIRNIFENMIISD